MATGQAAVGNVSGAVVAGKFGGAGGAVLAAVACR